MSVHAHSAPQARMLSDGRRLHLQHGPIDLVIEAFGQRRETAIAYQQAVLAFENILNGLVEELHLLRQPCRAQSVMTSGAVAQRMCQAAGVHEADAFITPMIAVAGAVADHVLEALIAGRDFSRAYVNNGGDMSLFLNEDQVFDIGVCANPQTGEQVCVVRVCKGDGVGGVATSGWRGRSHSLGIADAVTVLAKDAASADAAATLIANAVNLPGSPSIERAPANELSPDSDLGGRLVTLGVEHLQKFEIEQALDHGSRVAENMIERGLVRAVFLALQGTLRSLGNDNQICCSGVHRETIGEMKLEVAHA